MYFQFALCYNRPECHPFIDDDEKEYLQNNLKQQKQRQLPSRPRRRQPSNNTTQLHQLETTNQNKQNPVKRTPWRQILTSVPFVALILCQVS